MHIIFGLLIVALGAMVTIKSEWFYENFGAIPSAEKYLGTEGGSRLAYQLIGVGICIIGFLVMTNLIQNVLMGIAQILVPNRNR